jgi:RHH-type transcriptional regulator, rel operon repressor / antitoxin RelB
VGVLIIVVITKGDIGMGTVPVSSRAAKTVSKKLDLLAKATARSRSFLIGEAIKIFVEDQAWQIEAIEEGVKQANQGKFASDAKVRKTFAKYGVNVDED